MVEQPFGEKVVPSFFEDRELAPGTFNSLTWGHSKVI